MKTIISKIFDFFGYDSFYLGEYITIFICALLMALSFVPMVMYKIYGDPRGECIEKRYWSSPIAEGYKCLKYSKDHAH